MKEATISQVSSLKDLVIGEGVKFSKANRKLKKLQKQIGKRVASFDLLSGYTCPMAHECKAWAVPVDGTRRVCDGPEMRFRCYSASQEVTYSDTFNMRLRNTLAVMKNPVDKLLAALPNVDVIRIHAAGDFFSWDYFNAWLDVARERPYTRFYFYTKMVPFLIRAGSLPENVRATISVGGKADRLISEAKSLGFHTVEVVQSEAEAAEKGLPIDTNDYHAYEGAMDFALVIHGTQPAKVT